MPCPDTRSTRVRLVAALGAGPGWAFMSYLVATLVFAVPLVPHIVSSLPNDLGDPLPNT